MKEQVRSFFYAMLTTWSMLSLSPTYAADLAPKYHDEVQHLLNYLGTSQCQFYRNGKWYGSEEAKEHLTKKYRYLLKKSLIGNTEEFIALGATESSASGKPYQVRCGSGSALSSAEWLSLVLERYRARTNNEKK